MINWQLDLAGMAAGSWMAARLGRLAGAMLGCYMAGYMAKAAQAFLEKGYHAQQSCRWLTGRIAL